MDNSKEPDLIHEHGTVLDKYKNRVRCKYCAKVMSGLSRLKHHLSGIRGDVLPCEKVPSHAKELMRDGLLESKTKKLSKEVGQLSHPNLSQKRNCSLKYTELKYKNLESSPPSKRKKGKKMDSLEEESGSSSTPCTAGGEEITRSESDEQQLLNLYRCIGRWFFYIDGINFHAADCPYISESLTICSDGEATFEAPTAEELSGWILEEEKQDRITHIELVKRSWERTGCSILLDGWTDEKGRNLISFLADCPLGTVFLRSVDASYAKEDVDALFLLCDGVIKEVGVKNVVQVITYNTSPCMEAVGKKIMETYRTIFWSVCAVHCMDLMLDEISMMPKLVKVLNEAKTITKLIYNDAAILKLMKHYTRGEDIIKPTKMRSAMPFLTLEKIASEKDNLLNMFESSKWGTSFCASTIQGKKVAALVRNPTFWEEAEYVLKAAIPLVRTQQLIDAGDKPPMGYIYETMDQAKEQIKRNFKSKKMRYLPVWEIIDATWNNHLHSPLHSAGYFLNPGLFYGSDFFADAEVASGLLCCIVRMVEDQHGQDLIALQLDEFRAAKGSFAGKIAVEQRTKTLPALWWLSFGGSCPELQRLAIRILSQTCSGPPRHILERTISERLHSSRNSIIRQKLSDLEFVHASLRLFNPPSAEKSTVILEDLDLMGDWIVCDDLCYPKNWCISEKVVKNDSSRILVKEEPH